MQFRNFPSKRPFPSEFLEILITHEKKYGVKPELLAIEIIFFEKDVSREHKMQLLKLNLDCSVVNVNASDFIKSILNYYKQFSSIFVR